MKCIVKLSFIIVLRAELLHERGCPSLAGVTVSLTFVLPATEQYIALYRKIYEVQNI